MAQPAGNGLLRWLIGGLVAGGIILGLLIGAYAIGYDRGEDKGKREARQAAKPAPPPPPATTGPAGGTGLAARGERLFTADGCSGCHSLDGSAGAGPTVKGLAGSTVSLGDGRTVTADDAYLERSITDPDAETVEGYRKGVMPAAIASFDLSSKPQDVAALVAFMKAQK